MDNWLDQAPEDRPYAVLQVIVILIASLVFTSIGCAQTTAGFLAGSVVDARAYLSQNRLLLDFMRIALTLMRNRG